MKMDQIRVGIVGAGNIAASAHLPAYSRMKDLVKVVAIADINRERAERVAAEFGIPNVFSNVHELLAGCDVDYVDVCTWNCAHAECTIAAARAGKNILCEKPMADSLEHALEMEREVKKAGVRFMLGVVTRFLPEAQLVKKMQEAGELGDIYLAKTFYTRRRGTPIGWFTNRAKSGGGAVIDIGVHCIDRTWYLMGRPKPVSVSASVSNVFGNFQTKGVNRWTAGDPETVCDTDDSGVAFIRFENGAVMLVQTAWAINGKPENTSVLYGSKAGVSFEPLTVFSENQHQYLSDNVIHTEKNDYFEMEIRHFVDCIHQDQTPIASLEDGVTVQRILDAIYRSGKEGHEVTL